MSDRYDEADLSLAAERTSMAWHRTGLTHLTAGVVLLRLLPDSGLRAWLGAGLLALGATASFVATRVQVARGRRWPLRLVTAGTVGTAVLAIAIGI